MGLPIHQMGVGRRQLISPPWGTKSSHTPPTHFHNTPRLTDSKSTLHISLELYAMNNHHQSSWASGLQLQLAPPVLHARVAEMPEGSHKRYPPTPYPLTRYAQPLPEMSQPLYVFYCTHSRHELGLTSCRPHPQYQTPVRLVPPHVPAWPVAHSQMPVVYTRSPEIPVAKVQKSARPAPRPATYESAPAPPPLIVKLRPGRLPVVVDDEPWSNMPTRELVYPTAEPVEYQVSTR